MNEVLKKELMELSAAERIQLAEDLWDSVYADSDNLPPLTQAQKDELDRRIEEHRKDPSRAIPYEEVRAWLWARRK
jgi:putative addiction module component (TIGR02574 family)